MAQSRLQSQLSSTAHPLHRPSHPIIELGSASYVLQSQVEDPRALEASFGTPLVVLATIAGSEITEDTLETAISQALHRDDVLTREFFGEVLFTGVSKSDANLTGKAYEYLREHGTTRVDFIKEAINLSSDRLSGAYFAGEGMLWKPYRSYQDYNNAFVGSMWPIPDGVNCDNSSPLSSETFTRASQILAPSRSSLLLGLRERKPLDGMRIAVKDIFDVQGTLTSLCSRAYRDTYPPASKTAESIQVLIDAGAVLVGKTRLCSFISKELATEAIDYSTPFNPRADGYQSPWGSSTGSAAAVSSYDWLDITIGSDTNGSGRRPANVHGLFGFRPTKGLIPMVGVFPSFERFDAPCLFSRNLKKISKVMHIYQAASVSTLGHKHEAKQPTIDTILYPLDFLPTSHPGQMSAIEDFVTDLESHLNVERTTISITDSWKKTPPSGSDSDDLHSWLDKAGWVPLFYDSSQSVKQFQKDYQERYGRLPYATPYNKWKWALGDEVTLEERNEEIRKLDVYRDWLLEEIFKVSSRTAVMILPIDEPVPAYRDAQPQPPAVRSGDLPLNLSPSMGAPELTIPLTDVPYQSMVSGRTEYLPVTVSILGTPGMDVSLIDDILSALGESCRPSSVLTGSRMFKR